jgi:hypothetical protein
MLFIGTIVCVLVMLGLVYFTDEKAGRPVWPGSSTLNDYLNADHHWHDWGHFLAQFFAVTFVMRFLPGYLGLLAILITFASTFLIEFVLQIHPGQTYLNRIKEKDVQFDIATHLLGGLAALFLI